MANTSPTTDEAYVPFAYSWQRGALTVGGCLLLASIPFQIAFILGYAMHKSAQFTDASKIVPCINLLLTAIFLAALLGELLRIRNIAVTSFFHYKYYMALATLALIVISSDSLAHVVRAFNGNFPTLDDIPLPMGDILFGVFYCSFTIPIMRSTLRKLSGQLIDPSA